MANDKSDKSNPTPYDPRLIPVWAAVFFPIYLGLAGALFLNGGKYQRIMSLIVLILGWIPLGLVSRLITNAILSGLRRRQRQGNIEAA